MDEDILLFLQNFLKKHKDTIILLAGDHGATVYNFQHVGFNLILNFERIDIQLTNTRNPFSN